jgi:hypothetical protein
MSDESEKLFWPFYVVIVVSLILFGVYSFRRNFEECLAVPHTTFYCITSGR